MKRRLILAVVVAILILAVVLLRVGPAPGTTGHLFLTAIVIVGGATFAGLLLLLIMRRFVPHTRLRPHNDVLGFTYAAVGIINAVLLGFVVITVWQKFDNDVDAADHEAHAVADLIRLLPGLPPAEQSVVRQDLANYLHTVVDQEWPAMDRSEATGAPGTAIIDDIWRAYGSTGQELTSQNQFYVMGLQRVADLGGFHRDRIRESGQGLPPLLWAMLVGGSVLTVGFVYLFGVAEDWAHAAMVGSVLASVALLLFLVFELQNPYSGDVRVPPESFHVVLTQFTTALTPIAPPASTPPSTPVPPP
jgi:hypothetical protein